MLIQKSSEKSTKDSNLNMCLSLFCKHVNKKITKYFQTELDQIAGGQPYCFTLADRKNASFTEATMMEVQRRACVATSTLEHYTLEDVLIQGYLIKKDTVVSVCV